MFFFRFKSLIRDFITSFIPKQTSSGSCNCSNLVNVCVVKIYGLNIPQTVYQFLISFLCSAFNWFEQTTKQNLIINNHYILFETITNNVQRLKTGDVYGTLSRAETAKLCLLNFHVISPNAIKYTSKLDKNIL